MCSAFLDAAFLLVTGGPWDASVELQQLVVSLHLLLMRILLFVFIIYDSTLGVLGFLYCWLDKTSNFKMSLRTLGICDEHFPCFFDILQFKQ